MLNPKTQNSAYIVLKLEVKHVEASDGQHSIDCSVNISI